MNTWFLPALTLLFVGLKLTGYVVWSWWWVLAPMWIPVAVAGALLLVAGALWLAKALKGKDL